MKKLKFVLILAVEFVACANFAFSFPDGSDSTQTDSMQVQEENLNDYDLILFAGAGAHILNDEHTGEKYRTGMVLIGGVELPITSSGKTTIECLLYNWYANRYIKEKAVKVNGSTHFIKVSDNTLCSDFGFSASVKFYFMTDNNHFKPSIHIGFHIPYNVTFTGDFGAACDYIINKRYSLGVTFRHIFEFDLVDGHPEFLLPTFLAINFRYKI